MERSKILEKLKELSEETKKAIYFAIQLGITIRDIHEETGVNENVISLIRKEGI